MVVLPGYRLEDHMDVGLRALGPGAEFSTDVLGLLTYKLMFRDAVELTKSFSYEIDVLTMALDTAGNNEGLFGSDIVHHKLLHHAGVNVADVTLEAQAWHA